MNKFRILLLEDEIIEAICKKHNINKSDIFKKTRKEYIILARNEAIIKLRFTLNSTLKRIWDIFNISHSSVHGIIRKWWFWTLENFTRENQIYILWTQTWLDEVLYPIEVN